MAVLILGLVLFLGVHSVRIAADGWRTATIARIGEKPWKGLFALASLAGFVLIVLGFGLARRNPVYLWEAPMGMRHLAGLLMLFAFVLLAAAYVPRNSIKARLHHPMVLSVKVWAVAHLLANGNLVDVVLFGAFLVWAVFDFRAARRRDRAAGTVYPAGTAAGTAITVVVGVAVWALFAFWAHGLLFGVRPFG
ncbi:NnrU family protein [Caenimonas terrae]|uniref:NnrU family protein n=1 Tax=Caenimonas terrae TaxID=696074 RepID=A0ABW0NCG7_9BURK